MITVIFGRLPFKMTQYAHKITKPNDMELDFPEARLYPIDHLPIAERMAAYHLAACGDVVCTTQSEMILLRLQRRVREGSLSHNDVKFVWIGGNEKPMPLRICETGDFLDEWPYGCFEDEFHEMFPKDPLPAVDTTSKQVVDDYSTFNQSTWEDE